VRPANALDTPEMLSIQKVEYGRAAGHSASAYDEPLSSKPGRDKGWDKGLAKGSQNESFSKAHVQ
jgi:hypothetical protein